MDQNILSADTALAWRKSSYSGNGNCVEVAVPEAGMAVRDSKDPKGPALHFTADAWASFIAEVAGGAFELR
ncbi:DUF397 domain-containing protein [Streptacidiphilus sp. PB12-B1b]|uniref:DUF397 domain-containing protein n=1 Tax=Streptacidiphilus sp. PB12-B1b TaxID=2705012 RepID=UPI0015FD90E3|nr:DUF397 domain-containing protein [Streptacidiphilus sp. PB12-B1b]QMU75024.1 DUF397 domain-containing protein [Streptacidiphilus sp. PB12-B1b]